MDSEKLYAMVNEKIETDAPAEKALNEMSELLNCISDQRLRLAIEDAANAYANHRERCGFIFCADILRGGSK